MQGRPHTTSAALTLTLTIRENRSTEILEKMCIVAFALEKRKYPKLPITEVKSSLSLQTGHRSSLRHENVTLVVSKST